MTTQIQYAVEYPYSPDLKSKVFTHQETAIDEASNHLTSIIPNFCKNNNKIDIAVYDSKEGRWKILDNQDMILHLLKQGEVKVGLCDNDNGKIMYLIIIKKKNIKANPPRRTTRKITKHEITVKEILNDAEIRVFACNVRSKLHNLRMSPESLDKQMDAVEGTSASLINPLMPSKPTKQQVQDIARILKVKPGELWQDIYSIYEKTRWKNAIRWWQTTLE